MTVTLLLLALAGLHLTQRRQPRPRLFLGMASANVRQSLTFTDTQRAIDRALEAGPDGPTHLVGFQEMHTRILDKFLRGPWRAIQKPGGAAGRCAIAYDSRRLKPVKWANAILNAANGFTFPAAGRQYVWALLRDRATGCWVWVAVVHFVPHADDPRGGITTLPRGAGLVAPAIDTLVRFLKFAGGGKRGTVVIMGDVNIDANADLRHANASGLNERLTTAGMIEWQERFRDLNPTHGKVNQYDRAWAATGEGIVMTDDSVSTKTPSDHRVYRFGLLLPYRRGFKPAA